MNISFREFSEGREVKLFVEDGKFRVYWKDGEGDIIYWNMYKMDKLGDLDSIEKMEYLEYVKVVLEVWED